jgi:hypothetical protein
MGGVREYTEGHPVSLAWRDGRLVIWAVNEGGNNVTAVDLLDVLEWAKGAKRGSDAQGG